MFLKYGHDLKTKDAEIKKFLASVAAAAVMSGAAFAADVETDLLAIASNGALSEQSEGIQVLSKAEESNVVGGYYKIGYAAAMNQLNLLYHRQALKEGRPTIYIPRW